MKAPGLVGRVASQFPLVVGLGLGALIGILTAASEGSIEGIGLLAGFPKVALVVLLITAALLPLVFRNWQIALWLFLVWLPLEDLARKAANNDLRVYYVKDLLYLLLLAALLSRVSPASLLRAIPGQLKLPLIALVGWSLALAVYAGLTDWRVPLLGLRMNFLYAPLALVGVAISLTQRSFERTIGTLAILISVVMAIGIAQAVIGPTFLAPGSAAEGLQNLYLERGVAGQAGLVYQPSGTFIDPGRYAQAASLALALGLSMLYLYRSRGGKALAAGETALAIVAIWAAGKRTVLLIVLALGATGLRSVWQYRRGRAISSLVTAGVLLLVALAAFAVLSPEGSTSRVTYLTATLDPTSGSSEWSDRLRAYSSNIVKGISVGGIAGQGVGTHSLGRQYLTSDSAPAASPDATVESGFGSVAAEIGLVGLAIWLWWIFSWWRCLSAAASAQADPSFGRVIGGWIAFTMVIGFAAHYSYYQNYFTNAFLWLMTGIIFGLQRVSEAVEPDPALSLETSSRRRSANLSTANSAAT